MDNQTANQDTQAANTAVHVPVRSLVAGIVLGLGVVVGAGALWSLSYPSYVVLRGGVADNDAALVTAALQSSRIKYQYDPNSGELRVPAKDLPLARVILAASGLAAFDSAAVVSAGSMQPGAADLGVAARHQSLEKQLANTIASIDDIQSARIHLALAGAAKDGNGEKPRASVVLRLYPGRQLSSGQINAILHLIASSTAGLSVEEITIVDQSGRLLKSPGDSVAGTLSARELDYRLRLEAMYVERIENILKPILGTEAVHCQVTADIDFADVTSGKSPNSVSTGSPNLRRLSATVIVDHKSQPGANGQQAKVPRKEQELSRIRDLVKDAIAFNEQRGDSVDVINEPFNSAGLAFSPDRRLPTDLAVLLQDNLYITASALVLLLVVILFAVQRRWRHPLRGTMANSAEQNTAEHRVAEARSGRLPATANAASVHSNGADEQLGDADSKTEFERYLSQVRQTVQEDPRLVAQVVRQWVRDG